MTRIGKGKLVIRDGKAQIIYPQEITIKHKYPKTKKQKQKTKNKKLITPKVAPLYTPLYDTFPQSKYGEELEIESKKAKSCSYCNNTFKNNENICEFCGNIRDIFNGEKNVFCKELYRKSKVFVRPNVLYKNIKIIAGASK